MAQHTRVEPRKPTPRPQLQHELSHYVRKPWYEVCRFPQKYVRMSRSPARIRPCIFCRPGPVPKRPHPSTERNNIHYTDPGQTQRAHPKARTAGRDGLTGRPKPSPLLAGRSNLLTALPPSRAAALVAKQRFLAGSALGQATLKAK